MGWSDLTTQELLNAKDRTKDLIKDAKESKRQVSGHQAKYDAQQVIDGHYLDLEQIYGELNSRRGNR